MSDEIIKYYSFVNDHSNNNLTEAIRFLTTFEEAFNNSVEISKTAKLQSEIRIDNFADIIYVVLIITYES